MVHTAAPPTTRSFAETHLRLILPSAAFWLALFVQGAAAGARRLSLWVRQPRRMPRGGRKASA